MASAVVNRRHRCRSARGRRGWVSGVLPFDARDRVREPGQARGSREFSALRLGDERRSEEANSENDRPATRAPSRRSWR